MKTVSQLYHETRRQAQRAKPRSKRSTILQRKLVDLMCRQLRKECRGK